MSGLTAVFYCQIESQQFSRSEFRGGHESSQVHSKLAVAGRKARHSSELAPCPSISWRHWAPVTTPHLIHPHLLCMYVCAIQYSSVCIRLSSTPRLCCSERHPLTSPYTSPLLSLCVPHTPSASSM